MIIKINEGRVGQAIYNTINKFDKLTKYDFSNNYSKDADIEDVPINIPKVDEKYVDVNGIDPKKGLISITFDGRRVSPDFANRLDPDSKDLYQYITDYSNHKVTMELPMNIKDNHEYPEPEEKTTKVPVPKSKVSKKSKSKNRKLNKRKESLDNFDDYDADWDYDDEEYDDDGAYYNDKALELSTDESVMVPTPTPYKSKNRKLRDEELEEELELNTDSVDEEEEDTSSDKFSYRVIYKDNDVADYEEKIVTAKDAEDAIKNFKEEMPGKFVAQVASDSFTDPQVYYQDGWSEVKEESRLREDFNGWDDDNQVWDHRYVEIATKQVQDSDGFWTDYTWYYDRDEDRHLFIFGDKDKYGPDFDYTDFECDSDEEAQEWFDSYGEDDLDEELELKEVDGSYNKSTSKLEVDIMDAFIDYMMGPNGGFESEKDIEFYLNPHIDVTKEDDGRTKVQFRYEAPSYDNQIDVANELSKVVEKYDDEAYFDLYMYGVLEAWIDYPFVYEYSESLELKTDEDEVLTETPGLTLSTPEVNYADGRDEEGISLDIEINGKNYHYIMKHEAGEEGKTPADIARTVKKMQKFSDGKALAYLKKNMIAVKDESLGESYKVHIDYGFQERTLDYPDKETAQKKVDQVNELKKQPYLRGLKVWMDKDDSLNESLKPSEETLEDCVQDYRENASGYEGITDYVETQYPRHPQEFKDKVISYIKSKTESLTEDLSDDDTEVIKTINDVYKNRGEIESDDAVKDIMSDLESKNISVDADYLGDMIVKSVEMIDQLGESVNLKEDYILHPGRKFKTKSGHMLKITDVVTSLSEFDGHPIIEIEYNYETTDGASGSSYCNAQDFYNMLQESINVGDRVSHVDDREPRQTGIVQDIKDGVAKVSFLYKGEEETVEAPVDKLQREWTQVSNIGQHKVDAMDMVEDADESLNEEVTYTISYDAGDNFSKIVKVKANSLGDAMREFREKNPDKEITSIMEESVLKESLNTYVVEFSEDNKYIVQAVDESDAKKQVEELFPENGEISSVELIKSGTEEITEGKKSGNSFKDHHICQGCGNPLSKCTCKVEGLDED